MLIIMCQAANPGCILEDFVRWHSPPDWLETEPITEGQETLAGVDISSTKGQLSSRMQKEGGNHSPSSIAILFLLHWFFFFFWLCFRKLNTYEQISIFSFVPGK